MGPYLESIMRKQRRRPRLPVKQKNICCKTCAHWDASVDKRGRRITRAGKTYECVSPEPALPLLPASVRVAIRGSAADGICDLTWPPTRSFTSGEDGNGCPFWSSVK